MNDPAPPSRSILFDEKVQHRRRRYRMAKDAVARFGVGFGGISVIIAITLIFFYLAYVVVPMFKPASAEAVAEFDLPGGTAAETLHLAMEEQDEIGVRFTGDGRAIFFATKDGEVLDERRLPLPPGLAVTSFAVGNQARAMVAFGLSNGQALIVRHVYRVTYPDDQRKITPDIEFPLGEEPVQVDPEGRALTSLAVQSGDEGATLVAATEDLRLLLAHVTKEVNFLDDSVTLSYSNASLPYPQNPVLSILLHPDQRTLYVTGIKSNVSYFDISDKEEPQLVQTVRLASQDRQVTSLRLLSGGISLMVGKSDGSISQWFPVRDKDNNYVLTRIRDFHSQDAPITALTPEYYRKGFLAADAKGRLGIYHATAERTLLVDEVSSAPIRQIAVGPRSNALLAEDERGRLHFWHVENDHPEISWSSLWGKVWYENYDRPMHIWQSSAANEDFEPKFSLTPISFGTLKAAFYAMIFAVPLAVMGAIFTAHFMSPRMRSMVKPTVEIMEALPTVILGFLAGLWLAPFMEAHLPGVFSMFLFMPLGILAFAYLWSRLPDRLRTRVPDGWEGALLIPAVIAVIWLSLAMSPVLENWFFDGNMRRWLTNELGIDFDQRNSLVVGLAMGFAVIPTIFSITEDAIFGVPKHLSNGSLALGATPWQTLWRVVLLTASPGIFSAIMIGLGRAVGETMIVLMATGNTPVMDLSIFQGMRTLSANIAVEMPESEVNSTHYRVLFLAGLVLFVFTFVFNTGAEIVRQRLRKKYSSL